MFCSDDILYKKANFVHEHDENVSGVGFEYFPKFDITHALLDGKWSKVFDECWSVLQLLTLEEFHVIPLNSVNTGMLLDFLT